MVLRDVQGLSKAPPRLRLGAGMAEGDAAEVKGRYNTSTRTATWIKGAVVAVGLDAASVDVLCMVLDLDYDKAVSTSKL